MPYINQNFKNSGPTASLSDEKAALARAICREHSAVLFSRLKHENATSRANELLRQLEYNLQAEANSAVH